MTGSFPTRPDGLVDGTRIPHDALTDTGCTHVHASPVVPHRDGLVDVWHCRDCGERWKVAAARVVTQTPAEVVAQTGVTVDEFAARVRELGRLVAATPSPLFDARAASLEHVDRMQAQATTTIQLSATARRVVTVPDTTTGPSGLLARFRHNRKTSR